MFMRDYYLGYDLSPARVEDLAIAVSQALSTEQPRANRDRNPVAQYYYLTYWFKLLGSRLAWVMELPGWRGASYLVPIVALFVFAVTAVAGFGKRTGAARAAAVLAMGFSTLTMQVVILIALQTYRGHLFHSVGLVVAAFMVGLSLGALWIRRWGMSRSIASPQAALAWYCFAIGAALFAIYLTLSN